jgi:hypothetical protein
MKSKAERHSPQPTTRAVNMWVSVTLQLVLHVCVPTALAWRQRQFLTRTGISSCMSIFLEPVPFVTFDVEFDLSNLQPGGLAADNGGRQH